MKLRPPLPGGPYLVVGLARSGRAAAHALRARGEQVIGYDSGTPEVADLSAAGVEVHLGEAGDELVREEELVRRVRAVIKSPGVPASAPAVTAARARSAPVLGELELAWRLIPNEFIAVTGTNGKTTTTELIGHIHREAGTPVAVAGNVGTAASSLAGELAAEATVVCESSSFQLEDTIDFAPEAAVLINLAEDHLDRHGDWDRYVAAKLQAFARQGNDDVAVYPCHLGIDDLGGCARRVCFGDSDEAEVSLRAGQLFWVDEPLLAAEGIRLRGAHNLENAMAAAAVCLARGIDPDAVRAGLRTFAGVPHRLEEVAERKGVLYVNDSKATNVASTMVALRSFEPGTVHLILGGQGKGQDFRVLRDEVARACAHVYLIGHDAPRIGAALKRVGPRVTQCGDLERAVAVAARLARRGQVVLLSPASASHDQFRDFEERGERFRELVGELGGVRR